MSGLELILFESRPTAARAAVEAGIGACIVDLEWRGKTARQAGADTEINRQRPGDLGELVAAGVSRRFCRLDAWGPWSAAQLEEVIAAGATDVLLPMVRSPREASALLDRSRGRVRCGVLVETLEAVEQASALAALPLSAVYVGLNDLAIARRSAHLFVAMVDGTVERLREIFATIPFGVAGATVVDRGFPIPSRLLLGELARLDCQFTFLRRSFRRDTAGREPAVEVARIHELWQRLAARSGAEVAADRAAFVAAADAGFAAAVAP